MNPSDAQRCMYCDNTALWSLTYLEGKKYMPVCANHETLARSEIRKAGSGVDDRVAVVQTRSPYESRRMWSLQCRAPRLDERMTEQQLGRRVTTDRQRSLDEAPPAEPPVVLRPSDPDYVKRAVQRNVALSKSKQQTFLQRMGDDWTTLRARKINDRIDLMVDGDRFTLYSKRG